MYDYIVKVVTTPFMRFGSWWEIMWAGIGFLGQGVFFSRFVIQWYVSEKKKRTVIPVSFWYISLVGSFITLLYSIHKGDLVFIMAFTLNSFLYIRNLKIHYRRRRRMQGLSFASGPTNTDVKNTDAPLDDPA